MCIVASVSPLSQPTRQDNPMTHPKGQPMKAEEVVRKIYPEAYSRALGMPNSPVVEWEIVEKILWTDGTTTSYKSLGECLPSEESAWLSALSSLAESDPESVVKAVWPEARADTWDFEFYICTKSFQGEDIGHSETVQGAWLSAALKVVEEMKEGK